MGGYSQIKNNFDNAKIPTGMVQGPKNGQYIPPPTGGAQLVCDVNGVTITTSGSSSSPYYVPYETIILLVILKRVS